jgi:hypothetical protein
LDDSDEDTVNDDKSEKISMDPIENTCSNETLSVKTEVKELNVPSSTPLNIIPPKGIFANLNFDDLFDTSHKKNENGNENKVTINEIDNINNLYGPLKPESRKISKMNSVNIKKIENTSSEDEWVEKPESFSKESSLKKKHSKHKKHKHKSKKKSHKHK